MTAVPGEPDPHAPEESGPANFAYSPPDSAPPSPVEPRRLLGMKPPVAIAIGVVVLLAIVLGVVLLNSGGAAKDEKATGSDLERCGSASGGFAALKDTYLVPLGTGAQPDYAVLSGRVGTYSAVLREGLPAFEDVGLRASWTLVADNGDAAAKVLVNGNLSNSLDSLTAFVRSSTAAITECTNYITALTPKT